MAEAIDTALGYGLVESQAAGFDDLHRLLRCTRRRPGSRRTKGNRGKVRKLIEEGRMKPASLRDVERVVPAAAGSSSLVASRRGP